ncbi:MAG: RNA polymerase sporulation sigma factor SigK [Oscillospiraceae bacterium]|nr:RNA polymerase sporulation sigma factor SigK [Oscillospiraceae bacterium]
MFEFLSFISQYLYFFVLHVCGGGSFPKRLPLKEEKELIEKASKGDKAAKNKLVEHNLRLVAYIIKKFNQSGVEQEDLVSIGTIGLIKAVNTYSPEKKTMLSSYASKCIENEILMHFRNRKKSSQDVSLNEAIDTDKDGNPLTLMDIMASQSSIIEELEIKINSEKLAEYIDEVLSPREKYIIIMRYGLDGGKPLAQREIAAQMNISRSYVSRIEKKSLATLRKRFEKSSKLF